MTTEPPQSTSRTQTANPAQHVANQKQPPFPWRLFFATLVLILSGHIFSVAAHDAAWEALHQWALLLTVAAVGALVWCARAIYERRMEHSEWLPALLGSVLASHWLALDLHHALAGPWWFLVPVGIAIFLWVASQRHHWQHELEFGRNLRHELASRYIERIPIRALVLIVSKPASRPVFPSDSSVFPATLLPPKTAPEKAKPVSLSGDLSKDIDQNGPAQVGWLWNWQQTLRAIQPHGKNLIQVWLLGSEDAYLADAKRLLGGYLTALPQDALETVPAVDLEKFDDLMMVLRAVVLGRVDPEDVVKLRAANPRLADFLTIGHGEPLAHRCLPREVAIDITGGIKIASVAGAVLTLNHAVVCQYVQSEGLLVKGEPEPYIYDLRWDPSLKLH